MGRRPSRGDYVATVIASCCYRGDVVDVDSFLDSSSQRYGKQRLGIVWNEMQHSETEHGAGI